MQWTIPAGFGLWQAALAVVPLAMLCGAICRLLPLRAATRHSLWVATLSALILPLILPGAPQLDLAAPQKPAAIVAATPQSADVPVHQPTALISEPDIRSSVYQPSDLPSPDSPIIASKPTVSTQRPHRLDRQIASTHAQRVDSRRSTSPGAVSCGNACDATAESSTPAEPAAENGGVSTMAPAVTNGALTTDDRSSNALVTVPSETREAWLLAWRAAVATWFFSWIETARWLRDGLARVPAIPTELWLGGVALLAGVQLARIARFRGRLRRAIVAPDTILRAVAEVAQSLGLRRAPHTLMIHERISPLIWCGRRPTLILPIDLWTQLDKNGRRAILTHELAHLQRLDHWVCWLEQAVTLAYWWHPLVWWIRKRIHEEADLSCDAWVTWLMPQGRRAYAEALLRTKQFVSVSGADLPAGGMAAASGKAREFSRRLTMVMTHSARPRPSILGLVLSAGIATAGWLSAPAWSCPPEEAELSKAKVETEAQAQQALSATIAEDGAVTIVGQDSKPAVLAPAARGLATDRLGVRFHAPTLGQTRASTRYTAAPLLALTQSAPDDDARLARLEAELRRLSEQLAQLRQGEHGAHGHTIPAPGQPAVAPTPPTPPVPPSATTPAPGAARGRMRAPQPGGPEVTRGYALPPEKLEALWGLMSRNDVPPRVSINGNEIQLHADEHHQQIFREFIDMIHPDGQTPRAPEAQGRGPARGATGGRRSMKAPDEKAWRELVAKWENDGQPQEVARDILRNAEMWRAAAAAGSNSAREKALVAADRLRALTEMRQSELANYEQMAEDMGAQAEQFVEQARAMMEQAAEQHSTESGAEMQERARSLEKAARELEAKARQLEQEARAWESKARKAEREVEQATDQVDELNSMIESFDEFDADAELDAPAIDDEEAGEDGAVPNECITPKPAAENCTPVKPAATGGSKVL